MPIKRGDLDEADHRLKAAVALDDRYQAALYQLGLVAHERGADPEAEEVWRRAVAIDSRSELGRWAATKLALLTGNLESVAEGQVIDSSSEVSIGIKVAEQVAERFGQVNDAALEQRLNGILKRLAEVGDRPERELRYQRGAGGRADDQCPHAARAGRCSCSRAPRSRQEQHGRYGRGLRVGPGSRVRPRGAAPRDGDDPGGLVAGRGQGVEGGDGDLAGCSTRSRGRTSSRPISSARSTAIAPGSTPPCGRAAPEDARDHGRDPARHDPPHARRADRARSRLPPRSARQGSRLRSRGQGALERATTTRRSASSRCSSGCFPTPSRPVRTSGWRSIARPYGAAPVEPLPALDRYRSRSRARKIVLRSGAPEVAGLKAGAQDRRAPPREAVGEYRAVLTSTQLHAGQGEPGRRARR